MIAGGDRRPEPDLQDVLPADVPPGVLTHAEFTEFAEREAAELAERARRGGRGFAPSRAAFLEALRTLPPAQWPEGYVEGPGEAGPALAGLADGPADPARAAWVAGIAEALRPHLGQLGEEAPWWARTATACGELGTARTFVLDRPEGGDR